MNAKILIPKEWMQLKPKLLRFVHKYGENRITAESLQYFRSLQSSDLIEGRGTQVSIAWEHNKLTAVSFLSGYGKEASLLVVAPSHRGKRIGSRLLKQHISSMETVYCQVAEDNLACMNACIQAGLRPVAFRYGPTGKPSLLFSNEREVVPCRYPH